MKKNNMEQKQIEPKRKVTTVGCPNFDNFSQSEQKTMLSTLLLFIVDYYMQNKTSDH